MTTHKVHGNHSHAHGTGCGHVAITHAGHIDYVHDGHLHRQHDDHIDECSIAVDRANPGACTPSHDCGSHPKGHKHGAGCGHQAIPHGDHVDYLADGHLHYAHGDHCDDHGPIRVQHA